MMIAAPLGNLFNSIWNSRSPNEEGVRRIRSPRGRIGTSDQTGLSRLDAASRFEFLPGFAARVIGVRRDPALARLPLCVER